MSRGNGGPRPPALPERLLERALPPGAHRDTVLGDLHELYVRRVADPDGSLLRARAWYWRHALGVAAGYAARRLLRRRPSRGRDDGGSTKTTRTGGGAAMADLMKDIRFALRAYRRSPGFLAVALLTLALGIGANTAVFSVLNAMYLRPLPFEDPGRLVRVGVHGVEREPNVGVHTAGQFTAWREGARSFASVAAFGYRTVTVERGGAAERVLAATVVEGLFEVLGVEAARGRTFTGDEEGPGAENLAVLARGFADRLYGGEDPVGTTLRIGGIGHTVLGVMPRDFTYPDPSVGLWLTSDLSGPALRAHDDFFLRTVARLAPGRSAEEAREELAALFGALRREAPGSNDGVTAAVVPLREMMLAGRGPLWGTLMAAVGLVLLIACINLANVLLSRAVARRREMALRRALGADLRRLVRQVVTESLVLAFLGGGLGAAAALVMLRLLTAWVPGGVPMGSTVGVDGTVLCFTLLTTLASGLGFGLAPAHLVRRRPLRGPMEDRLGGHRLRSALVAAQVALAVLVVVAGGLTLRSFARLAGRDPGIDVADRLVLHVEQPEERPAEQRLGIQRRLQDRVSRIPGVRGAALASTLPVAGFTPGAWVNEPGDARPPSERTTAKYQAVTPGYFEALGIPILRGRTLGWDDGLEGTRSVVVSRRLAEIAFPGEDPLGKRFDLGLDGSVAPVSTVVGVVDDVRLGGMTREVHEAVYGVPGLMPWWRGYELIVHVDPGRTEAVVGAIRAALRDVDPAIPPLHIRTLDAELGDHLAGNRNTMLLFGLLAVVGLVLAMVGVFGMVAFAVAARSREIGIRMAVGADAGSVRRLFLRQGLTPVAVGLAVGLVATVLGAGVMEALLVDLDPVDPPTLAAVALAVAGVACLAVQGPVHRALHVDPVRVLARESPGT